MQMAYCWANAIVSLAMCIVHDIEPKLKWNSSQTFTQRRLADVRKYTDKQPNINVSPM